MSLWRYKSEQRNSRKTVKETKERKKGRDVLARFYRYSQTSQTKSITVLGYGRPSNTAPKALLSCLQAGPT